MKRTGDSKTLYQIIEKGDGTFYPNIKNSENGMEFGAWHGYCKTYDQALSQLQERIKKDREFARANTRKVVYEITTDS